MGRAKRDMEEREAAQARKINYLKEIKGYTECVECTKLFISPHGSLICDECFGEKLRKE
ncbi:hypothetical protein [Rossellomorea aquimaris]|uniref:hypothetical protein n=1 Tax=Rossellomorea aquimaris TaxID=189382 RepID=UPI000AB62944|nr:hypothetical protein [Rossellomorea aquimaris]